MTFKEILDKGIIYIKKEQQADGSFANFTSGSQNFITSSQSETIFLTANILSCLNSLSPTPLLEKIKKKAVSFLLQQKSDHWSFNYWKRESQESKSKPYPDDLDDTFCALSAISMCKPELLDGEALAKITTILTAVEEKEGGPYQTWIVPPDADTLWRDIDLAVNANVAYFLALQDVFLPHLRNFFREKIAVKDLSSKYYPSIFPVTYFLSRYVSLDKKFPIEHKKMFLQYILTQSKNGYWDNPLYTALAVSSLLRLGTKPEAVENAVAYLARGNINSSWPAFAFCFDPATQKTKYYSGSSALTTGFCLEAINKYAKFQIPNSKSQTNFKYQIPNSQNKIYNNIVKKAKQRFSLLGKDIQKQALLVLSRVLKSDKDKQIVLLPYYFSCALAKKSETKLVTNLGLANLYGWIAYRIYDDFLDEEGKPVDISVANVCLRELTAIYNSILPKTEMTVTFREVMDSLDNANTWEVTNCRIKNNKEKFIIPNYGDYSQLANKSLGHALGPLAILLALGYLRKSSEVRNTLKFFKHYIIARQLNDDAHDWEDDLNKNHINAVGALVLKKDKNDLQKTFWFEIFPEVSKLILNHCQLSQRALNTNRVIKHKELLANLITPIERSAEEGAKKRKESLKFLKTYRKV